MTGATAGSAGTGGSVPAPAATDNTKFLCGDGTWASPAGGGRVFKKFSVTANGQTGTVQITGIGSQTDCDATGVAVSGTGDTLTLTQSGSFLLDSVSLHYPAGFNTTTNIYVKFNCLNASTGLDDMLIPNLIHYNGAGVIQAQTNITVSNTGGVTQITKAGLTASAAAKWLMRT